MSLRERCGSTLFQVMQWSLVWIAVSPKSIMTCKTMIHYLAASEEALLILALVECKLVFRMALEVAAQ